MNTKSGIEFFTPIMQDENNTVNKWAVKIYEKYLDDAYYTKKAVLLNKDISARIRGRGKWTEEKKVKYLMDYCAFSEKQARDIVKQSTSWNIEMPLTLADYYVVYFYSNAHSRKDIYNIVRYL